MRKPGEVHESPAADERAKMTKTGERILNGPHGDDCLSTTLGNNATNSRLRSLPDRVRQVALYEIGGVCLISPLLAMLTGASPIHTAGLLMALALVMGVWNGVYSTGFDWAERAITGRAAENRPALLRAAHAAMMEAGGVAATTPVIAAWSAVSWRPALLEDLGLTLAYSAYALCLGMVYDSFPIDSKWTVAEVTNE